MWPAALHSTIVNQGWTTVLKAYYKDATREEHLLGTLGTLWFQMLPRLHRGSLIESPASMIMSVPLLPIPRVLRVLPAQRDPSSHRYPHCEANSDHFIQPVNRSTGGKKKKNILRGDLKTRTVLLDFKAPHWKDGTVARSVITFSPSLRNKNTEVRLAAYVDMWECLL